MARALSSDSLQTIEERLPLSGRIASGPGGHEELMGDALMRAGVVQRADQCGLAIGMAAAVDSGTGGGGRGAAIAGDQQACGQLAAIRQGDAGVTCAPTALGDL